MNAFTETTLQISKPLSDSECDVTENWCEASGDEDAQVTAFFDHRREEFEGAGLDVFWGDRAELTAIAISEDDETRYYARHNALVMLGGADVVSHIEEIHTNQINGF